MKRLSLFFLCITMALSLGCQKETEPIAPQQEAAVAAACKCGSSCTECRQNCLFCNCTRYCSTCGNQTYPLNRCVCGNGGGNSGSDLCSRCGKNPCVCSPCRDCGRIDCVCNKYDKDYPIEYMDKNMFSSEGGAGSQRAAFRVRANYLRTGPSGWPGHNDTRGQYIVYDGNRFDRSASNLGRLYIDEQLKKFKVPVIAKIRCIPEDDMHMYYGLEYYVAITGTGGPETYYTYMDLKIESYMEFACDTQNNRFLFEGSDKPLRDPHGTYGGCPYIIVEIY